MEVNSIGLPSINNAKGDKRAFLPSFIKKLKNYDVDVFLEKGYGAGMGFSESDYIVDNERVKFVNRDEVFGKDLVIVLKAPGISDIKKMKRKSGLISMLHYETREELTNILRKNEINSFSMDSITDDKGKRMVVTYEKTAEGGVFSTIDEMERRRDDFYSPDRGPYNVVVLGMGNLGIAAGKSFFSYLNKKVIENSSEENVSECIVSYIEKDSISNKDEFKKIFNNTDVLVDATKRQDFSEYIITNELIEYLKKDSIILDLTADPYDTSKSPIQVKAIEGIPTGDLNKYIFEIDEKEYDDIPAIVNTKHRRTVISCSGWPGIFPESTMEIYEDELVPFLEVLMNNGMEVSIDSGNIYERALYRSTVGYFDKE